MSSKRTSPIKIPGRPVMSNCGTPTEKASGFLDFRLKPLIQNGWSYIRDSGDFIDKIKRIGKVPEGYFLVTADVAGLYPSIPHKEGILALKSKLEEQTFSKIPTNDKQNLFLKIIFLNLTTKLSSRSLVLLLGLSLLLHTSVFIQIKLRQIFLKRRSFNHLYG